MSERQEKRTGIKSGSMNPIALPTILFLVGFALVTTLHALSIRRVIPWSFRSHVLVMGTLWGLVQMGIVILAFILPARIVLPPSARAFGVLLIIVGIVLATWHRLILGRERVLGGRFFDVTFNRWTGGGLYRYLADPIYDGYFLVLGGLFLLCENTDFLILACASLLFLSVCLSRMENEQLRETTR